jgi:CcmD family protein
MFKRIAVLLLTVAALMPVEVWAQTDLAAQRLGRGFWHVFIAYAIAWLLILVWMVTILRRLARVERKLNHAESD